MNRETRNTMNTLKQNLVDFFQVYFDEPTAKKIRNHPEQAIPLLKEAMLDTSHGFSKGRLTVYACALREAVELETMRMTALAVSQNAAIERNARKTAALLAG